MLLITYIFILPLADPQYDTLTFRYCIKNKRSDCYVFYFYFIFLDFLTHINCQNYICKQNKWYVLTVIPLKYWCKTGFKCTNFRELELECEGFACVKKDNLSIIMLMATTLKLTHVKKKEREKKLQCKLKMSQKTHNKMLYLSENGLLKSLLFNMLF